MEGKRTINRIYPWGSSDVRFNRWRFLVCYIKSVKKNKRKSYTIKLWKECHQIEDTDEENLYINEISGKGCVKLKTHGRTQHRVRAYRRDTSWRQILVLDNRKEKSEGKWTGPKGPQQALWPMRNGSSTGRKGREEGKMLGKNMAENFPNLMKSTN